MRKPLLIYGAGGLGHEIVSMLRSMNEWEPIGFIDDNIGEAGGKPRGLKVYGNLAALNSFPEPIDVILAVGDPVVKSTIVKSISNPRVTYPVLIHPSVILQHPETINIGPGSILAAGVILTTEISIGEHVLINLNATIGHNTNIGNYVSVMPGVNIAGEVTIEESVLIGSGANVINRVAIGRRSKIGMGAAVIEDVPSGVTVVGVPAKPV